MTTDTSSPTDCRIGLKPPSHWQQIELHPERQAAQLNEALNAFKPHLANWEDRVAQIRPALQRSLTAAWSAGIRLVMVSTPQAADANPLLATYILQFLRPTSISKDPKHQLDLVVDNLLAERDSLPDNTEFDIQQLKLHEFGDAVQAAQISPVEPHVPAGASQLKLASLRLYVPIGEFTLFTQAFTPQVHLAEHAFKLFSEINSSLRFA